MNNDLISRQAALSLAYFHGESATWDNPMPDGVDAVDVSDLEALPSVHPEQKAAGRWIVQRYNGIDIYTCSRCQKVSPPSKWNFCPNCGAFKKR